MDARFRGLMAMAQSSNTVEMTFMQTVRRHQSYVLSAICNIKNRRLSQEKSVLYLLGNKEHIESSLLFIFSTHLPQAASESAHSLYDIERIGTNKQTILLLRKAAIRWRECKKRRFIHVPSIFWLESRQKLLIRACSAFAVAILTDPASPCFRTSLSLCLFKCE